MIIACGQLYGQAPGVISYPDPGKPHPDAPAQIRDFREMIGTCDCKSLRRNPDGSWADTLDMVWTFRYIMNGQAIQDETWRDGLYATSIRQFDPEKKQWYVSYYSSNSISSSVPVWTGGRQNDKIVLSMPQKAPNGMEGFSRLTFRDLSYEGFNWRGEWVDENETVVYPFWLIWCEKRPVRN